MQLFLTKKDGNLSFYRKIGGQIIQVFLKEILQGLKDGNYSIEIILKRVTRTLQQNKLYFAYLWMIADEVWYISEEMSRIQKSKIVDELHKLYKKKFIKWETIRSSKDKRRRLKIDPTTTTMDTKEFTEYIEKIRKENPYLPDPEDKNILTFIDSYYYK